MEVLIIDIKTGEVAWGGSSEFKRMGVFGTGETNNAEAAQELVDLIIAKS